MTPQQIALVQASWKSVQPVAGRAAELFYARLFALDPSLRLLFRGDMKEQGRKLMSMISVAVNALARIDALVPAVQALGRRHAGYGVEERHYDFVGDALVWTLKQGLGDDFPRETEDAWRAAYGVLASTMRDAAQAERIDAALKPVLAS
jgi:hemoglobin-like flavoprotein